MTHRKELLENAIKHTCGARNVEYGDPRKQLKDQARLWGAYLFGAHGVDIDLTAEDVAHMMTIMKISRTMTRNVKDDTYEDAAAYQAIAGEVAAADREEKMAMLAQAT